MEATRLADLVSVRGDVRDFIEAAEKLLSPALRTTALTAGSAISFANTSCPCRMGDIRGVRPADQVNVEEKRCVTMYRSVSI